jgi:hypothetical protein
MAGRNLPRCPKHPEIVSVGLLRNPIHVALNEVKGLLTLVESSSRRFFAALRMTRGGFFNNPSVPRKPEPAVRVQSDPESDIEPPRHQEHQVYTGHSRPDPFVSLCLCGELLSRFWGPSAHLTNAEILASLVVINQEDERQTMAATLPRERDSIAVLTNARR